MPHVKMSQKNSNPHTKPRPCWIEAQSARRGSGVGVKPGYTLIELLVALSVGVIISLAIIGTTIQGFRNIRAMQRSARLYSNAVFVQDLINYWVKQGRSVAVNGSGELEVTLADGTKKTIGVPISGQKVQVDGADVTSDADVRVTRLKFTTPVAKHSGTPPPLFHSARTEIDLETGTGDGLTKFSATSTTATRNQ